MAPKNEFTLNDFRKQFDQLEKMGDDVFAHMPGFSNDGDPKEPLQRIRRMIDVMTEEERADPDSIDLSHCQRIAAESGTTTEEIQQFFKQFKQIQMLMRQMAQMSIWERIKLATGFGFRNPPLDSEDEE